METTMKRRILSLMLALMMILSLASPALADLFAFVTVEEEEIEPSEESAPTAEYAAGELTDGDGSYTICVSYGPEAEIPEGAELVTSEVTDPDAYLAAAENNTAVDEEVSFARFFDVAIVADGEQIQPKARVEVTIECAELNEVAEEESVSVVQFQAEETAEELVEASLEKIDGLLKADLPAEGIGRVGLAVEPMEEAVADVFEDIAEDELSMDHVDVVPDNGAVTFYADEISVYGIVGTELSTDITLPGSDDTYEVHVTYGADAQIPEGATLSVATIEKDSAEYNEAKEEIINSKKAENADFNEDTFKMAALDITILGADGKPVEPAEGAEVTVSIKMKELPADASEEAMYQTMEIQHLNKSTGTVEVETVAGVEDVKVANGTASAEFTLGSFSTFALTWTDESATIRWGEVKDGVFNEFDAAALDVSTGTFSLKALYDGYTYARAVYFSSTDNAFIFTRNSASLMNKKYFSEGIL